MPVRRSTLYFWLITLVAGVMVAAYIYIYMGRPLPDLWNDIAEAGLIFLAAGSSAVTATLNWRHFSPTDRGPRNVWLESFGAKICG